MVVDGNDLVLNADKVLSADSRKTYAAELLCLNRNSVGQSRPQPSPALWSELLRSTIETNPQCSSFILTNFISNANCSSVTGSLSFGSSEVDGNAEGAAAQGAGNNKAYKGDEAASYPTNRDLLDTIESLLEVKKFIYAKFHGSSNANDVLVEEVNRLTEPEDLTCLSNSWDFISGAYPQALLHSVTAEASDTDTWGYAMRVVESLDA